MSNQGEPGEKKMISFVFQECKYEYNYENCTFEAVTFPTNWNLKSYLQHKGYQDDEETSLAERKFGSNK